MRSDLGVPRREDARADAGGDRALPRPDLGAPEGDPSVTRQTFAEGARSRFPAKLLRWRAASASKSERERYRG